MKALFLTAATAALIFSAPAAFAADDHHGGGQSGGGHADRAAPTHTDHAGTTHMGGTPPAPAGTPSHGGSRHNGMTTTTAAPGTGVFGTSFHEVGRNHQATGHANNTNPGNAGSHNGRGGNNGNNSRGNRGGNGTHVTINFNRRNVTASHHYRYRGGAYRGPSGYSYHRYSYGQILPSIYFAQDYWISDYSDYGLADPPDGAVWVRYGSDAVLIDQDSGEILEVVYGQFY
jgi:Ni/Co efflux regulator RcnB